MLTDKQSLLLCTFIVVGFVVGGIFNLLDSYIAMGILITSTVIVILNIIFVKFLDNK